MAKRKRWVPPKLNLTRLQRPRTGIYMKHYTIFPLMIPSVISIPFDEITDNWPWRKIRKWRFWTGAIRYDSQPISSAFWRGQRAIELAQARLREQRPNIPGRPTPGIRSMPQLNGGAHLTGLPSIYGMKEWLGELGHSVFSIFPHLDYADLSRLRISIDWTLFTLLVQKAKEARVHLSSLF